MPHSDLETSCGKKQAAKELVGCFEDVPSLGGFPENEGLDVTGMITRNCRLKTLQRFQFG
jgi:hypothetical protein